MGTKDFFDFELPNSITVDSTNTNAVDTNSPLSFLDWVKYFAGLKADPNFLLKQYQQYVADWFKVTQTSTEDTQDYIKGLYTSLFRNIAVNFLNDDERRFISNANLDSPQDVAAIMPFFVRKIKDVCLYLATVRDQIKFNTYTHNLRGSDFSIERAVADEIADSFIDPALVKLYAEEGVTQPQIRSRTVIDIQELYNTGAGYYDINPNLTAADYQVEGDQKTYFAANAYPFDPSVFIDFDRSVVSEIQKYPVLIKEIGANFAVKLQFTAADLSYLKDSDFKNLTNNLDSTNLNLNTLKDALQTFSGTTFFYLSTNSTSQFTFGKLFEADAYKNYLNRRFPTLAQVPSDQVATEAEIGRFFKPDKRGILNFLSFSINGQLSAVEPDKVYVFPDPSKYGNITGVSKTVFESPFKYTDGVSMLKDSDPLSFRFGAALGDLVTKFRGYQSRSESLDLTPTGISKSFDSIEFFEGTRKDRWANNDVFAQLPSNYLPIDERQNNLQVRNDQVLVQSRSDIYGNEFALFKQIEARKDPTQVRLDALGNTLYCDVFDGGLFYTTGYYQTSSYSGFTFDTITMAAYTATSSISYSELSASPALSGQFPSGIAVSDEITQYEYLSVTTFDPTLSSRFTGDTPNYSYYIPSVKFFPELEFYRTYPTFAVTVYDSLEFESPTIYQRTTIDLGLSASGFEQPRWVSVADSGPFTIRGTDPSPIVVPRVYTARNTFVNATLSGSQTRLATPTSTLSADIGLYHEKSVSGDWVFRPYNNTLLKPVSAALSGVFIKYPTEVLQELNGRPRYFDLVYNTLAIETEHYLVFETLTYDYDTDTYSGLPTRTNYLSNFGDPNYTFFSNIWFNESQKEILVCQTTLLSTYSATNYKIVYFNLYRYDFERLQRVWPLTGATFESMREFSLSGTALSGINFSCIERPVLSYGRDTGKFTLKYLAKDTSNMFYDIVHTFKLSNELYELTTDVFKPDMFLHSENFGNNTFSDILYVGTLCPGSSVTLSISSNLLVFN